MGNKVINDKNSKNQNQNQNIKKESNINEINERMKKENNKDSNTTSSKNVKIVNIKDVKDKMINDKVKRENFISEIFKNTGVVFNERELLSLCLKTKDSEEYFGIKFDYYVCYNSYLFQERINQLYDNFNNKVEEFNTRIKILVQFDEEIDNGNKFDFDPLFTIVLEKLEIETFLFFDLSNVNYNYYFNFMNQLFESVELYKYNRKYDNLYFLLPNLDFCIKYDSGLIYYTNIEYDLNDQLNKYFGIFNKSKSKKFPCDQITCFEEKENSKIVDIKELNENDINNETENIVHLNKLNDKMKSEKCLVKETISEDNKSIIKEPEEEGKYRKYKKKLELKIDIDNSDYNNSSTKEIKFISLPETSKNHLKTLEIRNCYSEAIFSKIKKDNLISSKYLKMSENNMSKNRLKQILSNTKPKCLKTSIKFSFGSKPKDKKKSNIFSQSINVKDLNLKTGLSSVKNSYRQNANSYSVNNIFTSIDSTKNSNLIFEIFQESNRESLDLVKILIDNCNIVTIVLEIPPETVINKERETFEFILINLIDIANSSPFEKSYFGIKVVLQNENALNTNGNNFSANYKELLRLEEILRKNIAIMHKTKNKVIMLDIIELSPKYLENENKNKEIKEKVKLDTYDLKNDRFVYKWREKKTMNATFLIANLANKYKNPGLLEEEIINTLSAYMSVMYKSFKSYKEKVVNKSDFFKLKY